MTQATPLIAIVDDEESIRRAMQRLMRSARLEVVAYRSGDEFLETLPEHRPDCIILDLHMPKVDGFRVQAMLARAGYHIPVIVITGRDTPETRALVMEGGAFAYFRKPVDGEALLDAIAAATGGRRNGST
jgi:FixJ family two-component response regulator